VPKFHPVSCSECHRVLGYVLPQHNVATPPMMCFLCAHSFADMAEHLQLPQFPDKHDLYAASATGTQDDIAMRSDFLSALATIKN